MTPFRFGPPRRQLSGLHHPPVAGRATPGAVLLCNPFGQEAVRTHRMFRVLADRLAKAGMHVLRFDYLGTGDSDGDDTDGDLDTWRDDVLMAHAELQSRSMGAPARWVGARLGATLACLAAERAPDEVDQLVLWEPVTDGASYVAALAQDHHLALKSSYSIVPPEHRGPPAGELLGFEVGTLLATQFTQLTPASMSALRAKRVSIVAPRGDVAAKSLASSYRVNGSTVEEHPFEHAFEWASEEALNTALVPQEAIRTLAQLIDPAA